MVAAASPRRRAASLQALFALTPLVVATAEALPAQEVILSRLSHRVESYEPVEEPRPAVVLRRRADNLVQGLLVSDDTRNAEARIAELAEAITILAEAARRSADVEIALVVETVDGLALVRPFDREQAIATIENGSRPDTSQVRLLAKTAIVDDDVDQTRPAARIERFLAGVRLPGRAQLERQGEAGLSVVRPEQYRPAVVAAIAADLRMIAGQMGSEYGGEVTGLESPIEWAQLDELELGLFIRYRLSVRR